MHDFLYAEDVKEFIRLLRQRLYYEIEQYREHHTITRSMKGDMFDEIINELAGDALI